MDGSGFFPTRIGALPPQLAALCQTNINVHGLTVAAALTRKREHIYHAAMLDPHTAATLPLDRIWEMCDELIEAHQKEGYLPEFSTVVRNTGRGFKGIGNVLTARLELVEGFKNRAGDTTRLMVSVRNPGHEKRQAVLCAVPSSPHLELEGSEVFTIDVEPGQTITKRLSLKCLQPISEAAYIHLESSSRETLAVGDAVLPRQIVPVATPHSFKLALHGFPAGEGILVRTSEGFLLTATVFDSDIKEAGHYHPQQGSCLEVIADTPSGQSRIVHLCLLPAAVGTGKPEAWHVSTKREPRIDLSVTQSAAHYTVTTTIPDTVLPLEPGETNMLFDLVVSISALGDAHEGGVTSLSGTTKTYQRSTMVLLEW